MRSWHRVQFHWTNPESFLHQKKYNTNGEIQNACKHWHFRTYLISHVEYFYCPWFKGSKVHMKELNAVMIVRTRRYVQFIISALLQHFSVSSQCIKWIASSDMWAKTFQMVPAFYHLCGIEERCCLQMQWVLPFGPLFYSFFLTFNREVLLLFLIHVFDHISL